MEKQRDVVMICGKTGTGKSYHMRKMLEGRRRVIVFDTMNEYSLISWRSVTITDPHDLIDYLRRSPAAFRIVYNPPNPYEIMRTESGRKINGFDLFCEICFCTHNVTIAIEELAEWTKPQHCPDGLIKLARLGRHKGLSIFANSQRPREVSTTFRSQWNKLICFRLDEPADIDYIADRIGRAESETIKTLTGHKFKEFTL